MFRTGKRHKLTSEAGKRNERGVDPTICPAAADRVVELLVEYGGGTAEPGVTVVGDAAAPGRDPDRLDLPARISGIEISARHRVAQPGEVGATSPPDGGIPSPPPPWRPDLTDPYDLVEEVVRIVGYDQVPSVLPREAAGRGLTRAQRLRRRVGRTLAGAGCVEVVSFPFVGDATFDALGLPADDPLRRTVRLANPLSARGAVVHHDAAAGRAQGGRPQPRSRGSRTWRCSRPARSRSPSTTARRRSTASTGGRATTSSPSSSTRSRPSRCTWRSSSPASGSGPAGGGAVARPAGPTRSSWCADSAAELGVDVDVRSASRMPWHPGRCAQVLLGDAELGHAGELHPKVCEAYGVPARTAAVEIDLDVLIAHAVDVVPGPAFSTYPLAKEDVALVVDAEVTVAAGRGGAARGSRRAARVGPALRRLHRRPDRRGQEVAGLRAAVPGPGPDPHRGGDLRRPRRGGGGRRGAHRRGPAHLAAARRRPYDRVRPEGAG